MHIVTYKYHEFTNMTDDTGRIYQNYCASLNKYDQILDSQVSPEQGLNSD